MIRIKVLNWTETKVNEVLTAGQIQVWKGHCTVHDPDEPTWPFTSHHSRIWDVEAGPANGVVIQKHFIIGSYYMSSRLASS